ncbi:H-type small acid-soluble spore protein [Clostridiaceae bacterium 35-E11]
MDFKRAQEILSSTQSITVFHNGSSIWIESLDPNNQTALVRTTTGQMNVPIHELNEVH